MSAWRAWLERRFALAAHNTTVRTEVGAGVATFLTLSYILFVQPAVLSLPPCGMDPGGVLFATCVASALACFLMAWWANHPIALAPAMGHNLFFVFTVCAGMGFTWREALAANLLSGLAFLALAGTGLRERVMHAVPDSLKSAIAVGIGLLIATVGLQWGGLVVDQPVVLVQLGELGHPVALLSLFGLALTSVLLARGHRGAILVGIAASVAVGLAASRLAGLETPLVRWEGVVGPPPSPAGTAFELDLPGLFGRPLTDWLAVVLTFLLLDLFDTVGTLLGVARQAGLLRDGRLPRARGALAADAAGTVAGSLLGTSTVTSYVESAAGVAAGGRTGLTAAVTGVCLLASLVLGPLIETVAAGVNVGTAAEPVLRYPVIAPVLILIGALMMRSVRDVDWKDMAVAVPAFLTIVVMQLSFSITDGIAWGLIAHSLLALATSRARETPLLMHAFALLFLLRYVWLSL